MVNITNFTSVFEISFAINALFYFFDVLPKQRNKDLSELAEFDRITQKLKDGGFEGLGNKYFKEGLIQYNSKLIVVLSIVTLFNSALSLALLIWVGFSPNLCAPWYILAVVLFTLFVPAVILYPIAVKYRKYFTLFVIEKLTNYDENK